MFVFFLPSINFCEGYMEQNNIVNAFNKNEETNAGVFFIWSLKKSLEVKVLEIAFLQGAST